MLKVSSILVVIVLPEILVCDVFPESERVKFAAETFKVMVFLWIGIVIVPPLEVSPLIEIV